jgi:hypothetical protein
MITFLSKKCQIKDKIDPAALYAIVKKLTTFYQFNGVSQINPLLGCAVMIKIHAAAHESTSSLFIIFYKKKIFLNPDQDEFPIQKNTYGVCQ